MTAVIEQVWDKLLALLGLVVVPVGWAMTVSSRLSAIEAEKAARAALDAFRDQRMERIETKLDALIAANLKPSNPL